MYFQPIKKYGTIIIKKTLTKSMNFDLKQLVPSSTLKYSTSTATWNKVVSYCTHLSRGWS